MYVYTTAQFDEQVERHRIENKVDSVRTRVENSKGMHVLRALFEPFSPYWKRRVGKLRLLARLVTVGEDRVLCLLDVLERKDSKYEHLLSDRRVFGAEYLDPLLRRDAVELELQARKASAESERGLAQQAESLPREMYGWLESPRWGADWGVGEVIYESEDWVTRFRRDNIDDFWLVYHHIVVGIAQGQAGEDAGMRGVRLASEDGRYVLFSKRGRVIFLVAPFEERPSEAEIRDLTKKLDPIACEEASEEDWIPFAWRSYPAYILADDKSWLTIEREGEANLALSGEEEELLRSVSEPQGETLPIFINGRAGSGKSTMLLYLFADYCSRVQEQEDLPGEPLFLTYNEALLEVAKENVRNILSSHHRFLETERSTNDVSDRFFKSFRTFLFDLLPSEERERFYPEYRISFYDFKRLYTNTRLSDDERAMALRLPEAKRWTPELCWYVIRTFVKGYHLEEHTEPDAYQELPRRDRVIDERTYEDIYESIWGRWYKRITTDGDYWDDQDLIRRILELECYCPEYAAIFCDEAQDFTRLELQLIMRLSAFSKYRLDYRPPCLPFAFAGDPLQTLNPTGFRWDSVKATFYDEIIMALDPSNHLGLTMSFPELEYNYRSVPPVVKAANLVQLWRHIILNSDSLRPQECWRQGDFPEPKKFILGRNISPDELADYAENTIIIVPAEEGQEGSYVERDPVLSQVVLQREGNPPKNVLSAIKAKGLEFDRVVLYKFGEACDEQIWQSTDDDDGHPIELEYFFNKLYVAMSRAKRFLFIVDSEEGDRRLWRRADNRDSVAEFLAKAKDRSVWEEHVSPIHEGTVDSVMEITEQDPLSVAQELETRGEERWDPGLLRSAKQYYEDAGKARKATLCEAKALKVEGSYLAAGELFGEQGENDAARESFWEGECWLNLAEWYDEWGTYGSIDRRLEVARFMLAPPEDVDAVIDFDRFLQRCLEDDALGSPFSRQWRSAVRKYTSALSLLTIDDLSRETWRQMGDILKELDAAGYHDVLETAASCYYCAERYQDAVECWEQLSEQKRGYEYYVAKAEIAGFPDSLEWLRRAAAENRALAEDRILKEWQEAGGMDAVKDPQWRKAIAPLLERSGQYWEAHKVYLLLGDVERSTASIDKGWSDLTDQRKWEAVDSTVGYLTKQRRWTEALDVMNDRFPAVMGYDKEKMALQSSTVRELAYSNQTPASLREHSGLEDFVNGVLSTPQWQDHLSIKEAGAALERIGRHVDSLQFYERFTGSDEPEIRDFVRERWVANKAKQVRYHLRVGNDERANRNSRALDRRCHAWNFTDDVNALSQFPELPPRADVEGVRTVDDLRDGVRRFRKGHIEVSINGSSKLVLINDRRDFTTLRVDLKRGEVSGQAEVIHSATESGTMEFDVPASGYKGEVQYAGEKPTLELRIQNERVKISF